MRSEQEDDHTDDRKTPDLFKDCQPEERDDYGAKKVFASITMRQLSRLTEVLAPIQWQHFAACGDPDVDPETFFPRVRARSPLPKSVSPPR